MILKVELYLTVKATLQTFLLLEPELFKVFVIFQDLLFCFICNKSTIIKAVNSTSNFLGLELVYGCSVSYQHLHRQILSFFVYCSYKQNVPGEGKNMDCNVNINIKKENKCFWNLLLIISAVIQFIFVRFINHDF